ncbi:MAG: hypothetical protein WCI54_04725 [Bacteroidia bacterium]
MKTQTFILLFLILFAFENSTAKEIRFFLKVKLLTSNGDTRPIQGAVSYFVTTLDNQMKKDFPCIVITTDQDIATLLGHERNRQLLGSGNEGATKSIGDALDCDYLVILNLTTMGDQFVVSAKVIPYKGKAIQPIAMAMDKSAYSENAGHEMLNACDNVVARLMKSLKKMEICPFAGPVTVTLTSHKKKETSEEYPVFCNNQDETFKKTEFRYEDAETEIKLQKVGVEYASGYMRFSEKDSSGTTEENGCYKCPSGRMGGRTSTQTFIINQAVNDFSNLSIKDGKYINDVRIKLIFNDDSTYLVSVKGASKRTGKYTQRVEEKAEGTCDVKNKAPDVYHRDSVAVPCRFLLGPFKGAPSQKVLKETQDKTTSDPVSEDETTLHIEFDLKRD